MIFNNDLKVASPLIFANSTVLLLAWNNEAEQARRYKESKKQYYDKDSRLSSIKIDNRVLMRNFKVELFRKIKFCLEPTRSASTLPSIPKEESELPSANRRGEGCRAEETGGCDGVERAAAPAIVSLVITFSSPVC
ncbi:unnamed protein product [Heligmosomoides polygyrus]|uniref:Uncharacterized protein n=1 Tax=Heligmosomoides polygyrus TaxID=6339 RepID=A0A183GEC7_HELPZ|nr:unnamed protein product [Heligmosomoides polygyrus]